MACRDRTLGYPCLLSGVYCVICTLINQSTNGVHWLQVGSIGLYSEKTNDNRSATIFKSTLAQTDVTVTAASAVHNDCHGVRYGKHLDNDDQTAYALYILILFGFQFHVNLCY